jgi:acyl-coenzyme A synthetase/AMP-(fatty) acid ligase
LFYHQQGTTTVLIDRFCLSDFLEAIEKHHITALAITPPVSLLLAQDPLVDNFDLSSLRDVFTAGSNTPLKAMQPVKRCINFNMWNGLGVSSLSRRA